MADVDRQYMNILENDILKNGARKKTRNGYVRSVFDRTMRFNLKEEIPLLTVKKVYTKGIIHELLWFLKGDTNIRYLVKNDVKIWNDDAFRYFKTYDFMKRFAEFDKSEKKFIIANEALESLKKNEDLTEYYMFNSFNDARDVVDKYDFIDCVKSNSKIFMIVFDGNSTKGDNNVHEVYTFGDLGEIYGKQWRSYGIKNFDQIKSIIDTLKKNPNDRRIMLTSWNPDVLDEIALPACHVLYTFYTKPTEDGEYELSCSLVCRSQDFLLGTPFNLVSATILTYMIAQCANMEVGELIWHGMDCHVYENQLENIDEFLQRDVNKFESAKLILNQKIKNIDDFIAEDIIIDYYDSYPPFKVPLSVG